MGRKRTRLLLVLAALALTGALALLLHPELGTRLRHPARGRSTQDAAQRNPQSEDDASGKNRAALSVAVDGADLTPALDGECVLRGDAIRGARRQALSALIRFDDLPSGDYRGRLIVEGYVGARFRVALHDSEEELVRLQPVRLGGVAGTVTADGHPVVGAVVAITPSARVLEMLDLLWKSDRGAAGVQSARTDTEGTYRFATVVPDGSWTVEVAHFEFRPVVLQQVDVPAGGTAGVDITLVPGAHLRGRVLIEPNAPLAGIPVHVLRKETQPGLVRLEQEAQTTTDAHGVFLTPALDESSAKLVKVWVQHRRLHVAIQVECTLLPHETRDLGDLLPRPGTVEFQLPQGMPAENYKLAIGAVGIPGQGIPPLSLADIPFEADGKCRIGGIPRGVVRYVVMDAGGVARQRGEFGHDESDRVVEIPALQPKRDPAPVETLTARITGEVTGDGPSRVWLTRDGACVHATLFPAGEATLRLELVLPVGTYHVHVSDGDRVGTGSLEVRQGTSPELTVRATEHASAASLVIRRDGEPVAEAEIYVEAIGDGYLDGLRLLWAKSASDGSVRIGGLPVTCPGVTITVLHRGSGRGFFVAKSEFGSRVLDLGSAGR